MGTRVTPQHAALQKRAEIAVAVPAQDARGPEADDPDQHHGIQNQVDARQNAAEGVAEVFRERHHQDAADERALHEGRSADDGGQHHLHRGALEHDVRVDVAVVAGVEEARHRRHTGTDDHGDDLVLRKYRRKCALCGSDEDVISFKEKESPVHKIFNTSHSASVNFTKSTS